MKMRQLCLVILCIACVSSAWAIGSVEDIEAELKSTLAQIADLKLRIKSNRRLAAAQAKLAALQAQIKDDGTTQGPGQEVIDILNSMRKHRWDFYCMQAGFTTIPCNLENDQVAARGTNYAYADGVDKAITAAIEGIASSDPGQCLATAERIVNRLGQDVFRNGVRRFEPKYRYTAYPWAEMQRLLKDASAVINARREQGDEYHQQGCGSIPPPETPSLVFQNLMASHGISEPRHGTGSGRQISSRGRTSSLGPTSSEEGDTAAARDVLTFGPGILPFR